MIRSSRLLLTTALSLVLTSCAEHAPEASAAEAEPSVQTSQAALVNLEAELGRFLFNDKNLSSPPGQACASCHTESVGFADPDAQSPTSEGVIAGRFGPRNSPSAAYALYSPALHYDAVDGTYVGGLFWDGRVSSLEDQAKGPFLNGLEMNNPDKASVVNKVRRSLYAPLFLTVYGARSLLDVNTAYDDVAKAIAAFERTRAFKPFTSKYDAYLAGKARLTAQEKLGLALFEDPEKGNCAACHPSRPTADGPALFTDFSYDNIGIPRNPKNRFYTQSSTFNPQGRAFVDRGLGAVVGSAEEDGKFKVPTLRNIARTAPYMHNGYFSDLSAVVDFYNRRDVGLFPAPEVPETVNHDELGNLGLTRAEAAAIVAFMNTLSDGYF